MKNEEDEALFKQLQESVDTDPHNPSHHFNLAILLWENGRESKEFQEKALEHFVISAKLNPTNGTAFRFLGHYYSRVLGDTQRACKCYQRAVTLNAEDFEAGEALCDLLDDEGKVSVELAVCRESSEKSPRAFWAFRRLGYLQVHQKKWSDAVHALQQAIRGYPMCADLWETLGLAYQRLGMFTAAIKSYGRAIELEDSKVFAMVESGNILLMLGSYKKGVEQFRLALDVSPENVAALFGLASGLLGLSKECVHYGAFVWGASLLEEASEIAKQSTHLAQNSSCILKLQGDIQLAYAKCFPWTDGTQGLEDDEEAFRRSIVDWKRKRSLAAVSANRSYQQALHLTPWLSNLYIDVAISADLVCSLEERSTTEADAWQLPEKMPLGGLLLEGVNSEFWVTLGCLSRRSALKQHALIRGLQLDVSLAVAWACLGKLYRKQGELKLTKQAFDHARSIDPSLALPWAGMATDTESGVSKLDDAYESCLQAVQILPLAEFQIGLGMLAVHSGHLLSPQVFGAIRQAVQLAPDYPESHNLNGLVFEARSDYQSAISAYRIAKSAVKNSLGAASNANFDHISVNLARALCLAGDAILAAHECQILDKKGLLDSRGLQIYAVSLWHNGQKDLALSVIRNLAASISSMDHTAAVSSISLIFKLLYHISGLESTVMSILKMPRELLKSSKISFIISTIDALDLGNRLKLVLPISRDSVKSHEEIAGMHTLIAFSKLVKHGSIQSAVHHLRKALHMFPQSRMIRSQLGYFLLSEEEGLDAHTAVRCVVMDAPGHLAFKGIKSACEIFGAAAVACCATGTTSPKLSFPTCRGQHTLGVSVIQQLQRWLHQEPWNHNAQYLLLLNVFQRAREEIFPQHLCAMFKRLICAALCNGVYTNKSLSYQYQKFQLLLCASEISLQRRDYVDCVSLAIDASLLLLPDNYLFFAHLLLCRTFAAQENFSKLQEEYMTCLKMKTDHPIGWICLKFLESWYRLQIASNAVDINFEKCLKVNQKSRNMWVAIFELVQSRIFVWDQDFLLAEKILSKACLHAGAETCLFLCHGVICMDLARKLCGSQFLPHAIRSLKKAQENSPIPLPIISALLALAEASLGAIENWAKNIQLEWLSWPPGRRPAESYFQIYLFERQRGAEDTLGSVLGPRKWLLQAIHLNPSCLRYWKLLHQVRE